MTTDICLGRDHDHADAVVRLSTTMWPQSIDDHDICLGRDHDHADAVVRQDDDLAVTGYAGGMPGTNGSRLWRPVEDAD